MSEKASQPQQRIRVGLTGLAFVFLLVLLGAAISRSTDGGAPANDVAANPLSGEPNEPLAEIGAAPGQSQGNGAVETVNQAAR